FCILIPPIFTLFPYTTLFRSAITIFEMPLQFRLVRQDAIQTAVQTRVVDLPVLDPQQIVQRRPGIPTLFDRQLTAWRAQPVDRQDRKSTRLNSSHLGISYAVF